MKKILVFFLNTLFFLIVVIISIGISTFAITRKINEYNAQYSKNFSGSVVKKTIPVLSFTKGIVKKINIETGDKVKQGEVIITLTNPPLENELKALKEFPSNASAQTQAKVYEQQIKMLTIISPSNGLAGEINVSEGTAVDEFTKLLTIYSNDNIRFFANLSIDQYQAVQHSSIVNAYSPRLNQSFVINPDNINPNEKKAVNYEGKKIGLYFKFKDPQGAVSLLNNEDLSIQIPNKSSDKLNTPIDIIVNFWNYVIPPNK